MTEERSVGELSKDAHCCCVDVTWKIPNFFSLERLAGSSAKSPSFTFVNATWCLRLYPYGGGTMSESICVRIVRLHTDVPIQNISYELSMNISNSDNYENSNGTCHLSENCYISELIPLRSKHFDLFDMGYCGIVHSCTILCKMKGTAGMDASCQTEQFEFLPSNVQMETLRRIDTLCRNFKDLLLCGQNHDVTLKVMDKEFRAHQDVLRARCPVFQSMLSHDMTEKNSGAISIPDCEPGAFEQFLFYIYSGKLETLDQNNMLGLYYIADKYDMADLKVECSEFIKKSLTTRVICDVIELASRHSDSGLLECATNYFVENINEILPTVEWQSFLRENATKANEMFIKAAKNLTQDKV